MQRLAGDNAKNMNCSKVRVRRTVRYAQRCHPALSIALQRDVRQNFDKVDKLFAAEN